MRLSHRRYRTALSVVAALSSLSAPGCLSHGKHNGTESSSNPNSSPPKQALRSPIPSDPVPENNQHPPQPHPKVAEDRKPSARVPDLVGSSTIFIGWLDELPILKQEDSLSDGSTRTSFHRFNLDGSLAPLDPTSWRGIEKGMPVKDPPGLSAGKLLVQRHTVLATDPQITLNIAADEQQSAAMQKALQDWNDGKRDASQGFPSVTAVLSIQSAYRGQQARVLWKNSTTLGVSAGEAGFEYSEPSLSMAVLSDGGKRLYVEIASGENVDRHLFLMPENPR
jgi:hypothetical protein